MSRTEIENLPSNGRDFLSFSTQVAGVTGQQMSGQGSGISFNGQRARSNNISLDGVDANGALNGNTRLTISQEAVREFQVVTSQFAPEFGRASGGLVNIVSRSGTNQLRGNAFLYVRDESMDARNAFVTEGKPQFQRQNFGATLGGPLKQNQTFFFGAFERMQRDESGVITISDAAVATINSVLASRPIPNSRRVGHRQRRVPHHAPRHARVAEARSHIQLEQHGGLPLHLRQERRRERRWRGHRRPRRGVWRRRPARHRPVVPRRRGRT